MSGVEDLVQFLRAQYDEDERLAHEEQEFNEQAARFLSAAVDAIVMPPFSQIGSPGDPARVRAEVEAKRLLLDDILRYEAKIDGEWGCVHSAEDIAAGRCSEIRVDEIKAFRLLALPYADREGYRDEWRP